MKILLVALLSIGMSLASPRPDQCNILRASPFMASTLSGDLKTDLEFLVEFSRFMNYKTPGLLQEFVAFKSMRTSNHLARNSRQKREVEEKIKELRRQDVLIVGNPHNFGRPNNHGNQHNHDHPAFDVEVEEDTLSNVVNSSAVLTQGIANVLTESTGSVIDLLQAILEGAGSVVSDVLPSNIWNYLCIATWYPLHEERCKETRCTVCAPAIMSAAAACEKARGKITHICVQRVMGEGSCNYCIGDFMN
ncbi:uncharacterized protein [Lepeophtheirus salmonis]|nr:uncharacterized protein LOC121130058 [Lepeophtheirus salmonis]